MKKLLVLLSVFLAFGSEVSALEIRVAHMPNVTHTQALIGRAKHWFEDNMGEEYTLQWQTFNAGPSIIEAMFGNRVDIAFLGPGPAINGYVKSGGGALNVIAGSASGGAAFVVRKGAGIKSATDLPGKRIATPQLGNTQDIALRAWLQKAGLKSKEKGGTVSVLPMANPDQLTLFLKGELDGAWTVEPWVSRLVQEGGGEVLFEESGQWPETGGKYPTTLVIVRKKFLQEHREAVSAFLSAHHLLTQWINANRAEAIAVFNEELGREIGKPLPLPVLRSAFGRLEFDVDPLVHALKIDARMAYELGFLGRKRPDLRHLADLSILEAVLQVERNTLAQSDWWI